MPNVESRPIPLLQITEPSHRLRESIDAEQLGGLADSIAAQGLLQAIGLRGPGPDGRYEIIFGHRRYLAHRLLRREEIDARIWPWNHDPLDAAAEENLNRVDLTPMDEARLVLRYTERGEPDVAIARVLRRSPEWVAGRRSLLALPPELQNAIHDRELPVAVCRALAGVDHAAYRQSLIDEAKRSGATVRVVEVWAAHYAADRDRIVANHMTIEGIAARREEWKIMIACELCGEQQDYQQTRAVRWCLDCLAAVGKLVEREAAKVGA